MPNTNCPRPALLDEGDQGPGSYSGLEHLTENRGVEGSNPPQAKP